jgi:hypothetical protein
MSPPCASRAAPPGTPSRRARRRSKRRTQPLASQTSVVTRTRMVYTSSPSLTSAGLLRVTFRWPQRFGGVAETSRQERAIGLLVVTAAVHSRLPLGTSTASATQTRSRSIEARNSADEVACGHRHRDHHGQHLIVLFDLRRGHPLDQLGSGGSQRRRRRIAPSVSVSSPPRCSSTSTCADCKAPRPGGFGGDRSSEPGR